MIQNSDPELISTKRQQLESLLQNAVQITEASMDMKEKLVQSEKYVFYLRSVVSKTSKNIRNLCNASGQFLLMAQRVVSGIISTIDKSVSSDNSLYTIRLDCEKLLKIIDKELQDLDDTEESVVATNVQERIKNLETKQKQNENITTHSLQQSGSVKSVKSDVDEKYPENWSRDSLIDLNNVINLPPVPEDIFTCFSSKPQRTSSLSSLKGMRKVKLFLQRAASNSDDEDSSDIEDHDIVVRNSVPQGDVDERFVAANKKFLGNIKEETQD